jgi:hypothetical protein
MQAIYRLLFIFVLSLFSIASAAVDEAVIYRYGYLTDVLPGSATLYMVNPADTGDTITRVIKLQDNQATIEAIYPSPDGRFVIISSKNARSLFPNLSLYDVSENRMTFLTSPALNIPIVMPRPMNGSPVWSPDSTTLAFHAYAAGEGGPIFDLVYTYVYAVETDTLTRIEESSTEGPYTILQEGLAYSQDSRRLFIYSSACLRSGGCTSEFDIYDLTAGNNTVNTRLDFDVIPTHPKDMCFQSWSPDGRYISFQAACEPFASQYFGEIFVWDTLTNTVTKLTENTNVAIPYNECTDCLTPVYSVNYDSLWIDKETLLLSETASPFSVIDSDELYTATKIFTGISDEFTYDDATRFGFAYNPFSDRIAYRRETFSPDSGGNAVSNGIYIEIARYADRTFDVLYSDALDEGSTLSWSPDGDYLGFIYSEPVAIDAPPSGSWNAIYLAFVRDADFTITQHDLPEEYMLAGWIALPE